MGKFEKYMEENRESFDNYDLPEGHENRFLSKLSKKKSSIGLKIWYGAAASLIFLTMLSYFAKDFIFERNFINSNSKIVSLSDISSKYREVEEYYQAGIDEKIIEFKHLDCVVDQEQILLIDKELAQFDKNYQNLQIELKNNMNDERIINAMINNYQTKIRFLELVIDQIKQNC
jgi:hypothetical protein